MKRTLLTAVLIFFVSSHFFSTGIGAQINAAPKTLFSMDSTTALFGASFSIKPDTIPFYISFDTNYNPYNSCTALRLCADYKLYNPQIAPNWNIFFMAGVTAGAEIYSGRADIISGARAVIGTACTLFDGFMEPFIQLAVQPVFSFDVKNSGSKFSLEFPLSSGLRIWF